MRSIPARYRPIAGLVAATLACAGLLAVMLPRSSGGPAAPSSASSSAVAHLATSASGGLSQPAAGGSSVAAGTGGEPSSTFTGAGSTSVPRPTTGNSTSPGSGPTAGITPTPAPSGPPPAGGYYVSTTGHDTGSGSPSDPWLTLQHAADAAPSGATIYVRGGTYGPFSITRSGLTFTGYSGETAVVKGSAAANDAVHIEGVTSAVLSYLTVTGNVVQYGSGIRVESSSGVTLSHLIVHDNTSFGIRTNNSSATIEQSDVYLNHTGIEVARSGTVSIRNNNIHDNNKWIDSGVGAQGISFYYTTGSVVAANNRIWGNHTLPGDPLGQEGKAFEIYGARNVTMTANVTYDNRQVLETGTDPSRTPCTNLTFTKNVSYRSNSDPTMGLILRCADHSLVAANTFVSLDKFAFDISSNYETYGGSVEGLRILDNLVVNGRTYSIDNAIPASVVMDYNLAYTTTSATAEYGTYDAWVAGHDQTRDLSVFQGWTGQAAHDIWGLDPLLDSNFCPKAGSPAINAGVSVGLSYSGSAPDIGYCEAG